MSQQQNELLDIVDAKFASGINNINVGLYPYALMCVSTVYSVLSLAL